MLHISLAEYGRRGGLPVISCETLPWNQRNTSQFPELENRDCGRLGHYGIQERNEPRGLSHFNNEGFPTAGSYSCEYPTVDSRNYPTGSGISSSSHAPLSPTSPVPLLPPPRPNAHNVLNLPPHVIHPVTAYPPLSLHQQQFIPTNNFRLANAANNWNSLNLLALNAIDPISLQQWLLSIPTHLPLLAVSPDTLYVVQYANSLIDQYTGYPVLPEHHAMAMSQVAVMGQTMPQLPCDARQTNGLSAMAAPANASSLPSLHSNGSESSSQITIKGGPIECGPQVPVTQPVPVNPNPVPTVECSSPQSEQRLNFFFVAKLTPEKC